MTRCGNVLALGFSLAIALASAGCGGAASVEGTVTYQGQPIEKGSIAFIAQDGGETPLTVGQEVTGGKYSIAADRGLQPGQYKVEIYGSTKSAAASPSGDPDMQSSAGSNAVPEKYNSATSLTAELKSGENTVNFDLQP